MAGSELIKYLNDETFEEGISQGIVLVDFYADWCGPCQMLTPVIEELAKEMVGKATIVKVDTDKSGQVAGNYEITSIPTLLLFKDGQPIKRVVGLRDLDALRKLIMDAI